MSIGQLIAAAGESGALVLRAANVVAFTAPTDPAEQAVATVDFGEGEMATIPTLTSGLLVNRVCAVLIERNGRSVIIGQYGRDGSMAVEGYDIPPGGAKGQVLAKASTADGHMEWVSPQTGPQGAAGPAGADGVDGVDGKDGAQGPPGPVHPGGLTGQVLTKMADGDGEVDWQDAKGGAGLVDLPLGAITSFGGDTAPDGWLLCDGSLVSRNTYRHLFSVVGTRYGEGDGSTTFALPDMRDRFALGSSATKALGAKGGEETHTLTAAEMPTHSHGVADPGHFHGVYLASAGGSASGYSRHGSNSAWEMAGLTQAVGTGISLHDAGGGQAHNNMPPYVALSYIIRATPKLSGIVIESGDPVGSIHVWPSSSPAKGFRLCDGSTVAKADVDAESWTALTHALGADAAAATVTLPDLRDRFVYGAGTKALNATGGAATHTLTTAEMPSHAHGGNTGTDWPDHGHVMQRTAYPYADSGAIRAGDFSKGTAGSNTETQSTGTGGAGSRHQHNITAEGGGAAHNNMPPYIALSYVIRVQRALVVAQVGV